MGRPERFSRTATPVAGPYAAAMTSSVRGMIRPVTVSTVPHRCLRGIRTDYVLRRPTTQARGRHRRPTGSSGYGGGRPLPGGDDVPTTPTLTFTAVVLDAPDPRALGEFYSRLLGWPVKAHDETFVTVRPEDGATGLSIQLEEAYVPPVWPAEDGDQQMQTHLDIEVDDLEAGVAHATAAGATLAEFQPQQEVRVLLDPVGHPFCLWVR